MDRKKFIATFAPLGLAISSKASNTKIFYDEPKLIIPPYLKKGDTIGITCPAGYISIDDIQSSKNKMEEWGFNVKVGTTVGTRNATFAATDEERLKDFQSMLDDKNVKAIMCGRGGYGCNRIIDDIDFTIFKKTPKWIIGFSDITLLHTHINSLLNIASIHSKMCNSFLNDWSKAEPTQLDSINSIKDCMVGKKMSYKAIVNEKNKLGVAKGVLVGGNLSIICSAMKTKSELNTNGTILFLEEVGEYLYSMDRMLWNLRRTGSLKNLKGLIIGGFKHKPDEKPTEEFGENIYDIVQKVTEGYNYPICFDFPVGHQKANFALKCGIQHKLTVNKDLVTLVEV